MAEALVGDGRRRGEWAVIAGSSGGIGREAAVRLAEDGYSILACGGDGTGVTETCELIEWAGGRAVDLVADLRDPAAAPRLIGEMARLLSGVPVQVLVNNAGEVDYGSTEDVFDTVFNLNVRMPLLLAGALAPSMAARGAGAIVNVGGFGARAGKPDNGWARAARAALVELTRSWSAEYGPSGVRVNFVDPGDLFAPPGELRPGEVSQGDSGPAEVAEAIRFLASRRAAHVHGALLTMNGEAGAAERCYPSARFTGPAKGVAL
ncbi:putative oxidoreductase [Nocardia brasiliensis NBRC 14402]|uniref:SDR family NAD(P)-dependent oxidoreductase n=1 Tax=Nocardia brasiliensis TaxID=37326 RepID=UPI00045D1C57|nr:SDR family oxidoreductase [Nocardia brasiliensis]ASF06974.1 SDR family NAD(P)-dependent oxidoreductase [Nocardia brasiliensis]GAJ84407.1 putative oxidoreductase [Nocardia brasiliensis NBRC 14402]SUB47794.1 2-(R)-hydroxypropyl-CoM dehydrogenase [Nocardia brasiliensis]